MAESREVTVSAVNSTGANQSRQRRIWLCADDYGISPSVNAAICDLVLRGRLNATSVMVVAPSFQRSEALRLVMLNVGTDRVAIGLHLTLTAPFHPLSARYEARYPDAFLPLKETVIAAFRGRFDVDTVAAEVAMQIKVFLAAFGRLPDFIDGHHHVHLMPQIRDAVLRVVRQLAPNAWVRQCGRALPLVRRFGDSKGLFLDLLSRSFRARAAECGVATNSAFAGTYDFRGTTPFARRFPRFLKRLPDRSVVMCHPGFVDFELKQLDPVTGPREQEYAYFAGENFLGLLHSYGLALA